ncbi:hypothetical protein F5X68DRAFT_210189 [Plectosphaerella plurivora]|uniref:Uncharacterized protein n=1 Tax=Plectosphaerella plurivora TaxID=936078 RepID=A0A9P8VAA4_9PEZI|nr:hypothetical protein F5X68DRAFT_210189 [Plectosphaerella plurivora]
MSSPKTAASASKPELPPNVLIFTPKLRATADTLLNGRIFTRLATTSTTDPSALVAAAAKVGDTFCFPFRSGILIFDGVGADEDVDIADTHHEHFRVVCLALKDAGIDLDVAGCVFDVKDILKAGFQLDVLSSGSVLAIDLMDGEEESDDDEDLEASLAALVSGSGTSIS